MVLSVSLLAAVTGCGEQKKAQEMVRSANPDVAKGNQLVRKLGDTWSKIQKLPDNPTGYKQGVKLAKSGSEQSTGARDEYQKAIDVLGKAAKLDITEDYRKYIDMKLKAFDARTQGLTLSAQRFDQIQKLYGAAQARDIKKWKLAKARIMAVSAKIKKLPDSDKLDAAANDYAKKKNFGG